MRNAGLVLSLAAALGCSGGPAPGRPPPPLPPPGLSASLEIRDGSGNHGPFPLSELSRLTVDATCVGAEPGSHSLRIDILNPRGTLYAQWQAILEVGATGAASLSRALEVSGTPIDGFRQLGGWRFVLTLDDGVPLVTAEASLVE
jgi:hypothetical protein